MTTSVGTLVVARDADFEKALKWNLRRSEWREFMEPEVIDRTNEVLARMISSISTQLAEHAEDGTPEWQRRAKVLLSILQGRKSEVNRGIKELNRTEALEVDAWRAFAAKLAVVIESGGGQLYLEHIEIPGGDLTAAEWLDRRRARAEAQAVAA